MTHPVAIGDNGAPPGSDDGPLLAAFKRWHAETLAQTRRMVDHLETQHRQALYLATPNAVPLQQGAAVPASGTLVLDLGGPQIGRRWIVRRLSVSNGLAVTGTLTGRADFYVGTPGATPNPGSWQATFATLPGVQTFTSESIPVLPMDHLFAVISAGTGAQIAVATATVLDYATDSAAGPAVQVI